MLKPKIDNPKATLLLLFLNVVPEEENNSRGSLNPAIIAHRSRQIQKYLDIKQPIIDAAIGKGGLDSIKYFRSADFYLANASLDLFGDFDEYFERFLENPDPQKPASMNELAQRYKMKVKSKHTIIEPWPYRLTEKSTKEEFKNLLSESVCGHERYMEFERA